MTFREDESDSDREDDDVEQKQDTWRRCISVVLTIVIEVVFIVLAVKVNLFFFLALPLVPMVMFCGFKQESYKQLMPDKEKSVDGAGDSMWKRNSKVAPIAIDCSLGADPIEKKGSGDFVVDIDPNNTKMWEAFSLISGLPSRFSLQDLSRATNQFSRRVGAGGASVVYEGIHPKTGEKIAVKQLNPVNGMEPIDSEFRAELASGSANLRSMVRLIGFCWEGSHRILVYEYMANSSLNNWLFAVSPVPGRNQPLLKWNTRVSIAIGVAKGLAYWHEMCKDRFLYFNIKPQKVLLDENFQPKLSISNFGAPKQRDLKTHSIDLADIVFTKGYVAPEVVFRGEASITPKSDVFGFGMVLLELVSGRPNRDDMQMVPEHRYFPAWAQHCLAKPSSSDSGVAPSEGSESIALSVGLIDYERLVDPRLAGQFQAEEALRIIKVALWCIQKDPRLRPSMGEVVQLLDGSVQVSMPFIIPEFSDIIRDPSLLPPDSTSFAPQPCRFKNSNSSADYHLLAFPF